MYSENLYFDIFYTYKSIMNYNCYRDRAGQNYQYSKKYTSFHTQSFTCFVFCMNVSTWTGPDKSHDKRRVFSLRVGIAEQLMKYNMQHLHTDTPSPHKKIKEPFTPWKTYFVFPPTMSRGPLAGYAWCQTWRGSPWRGWPGGWSTGGSRSKKPPDKPFPQSWVWLSSDISS